jgi:hypothetical protein
VQERGFRADRTVILADRSRWFHVQIIVAPQLGLLIFTLLRVET